MYLPRRKCRKLLVWIGLAVVALVLFSLFLHGEFNFASVRRARITKNHDRNKSRLRLQGGDVDQMEHARGKNESMDYEETLVISEIKSTDVPRMNGMNLHNSRRVISPNQAVNLSAGIIGRIDDRSAKKKTNLSREFRTENHKRSNNTTLEDLYISVKTTGHYHASRVSILVDTWFQNAWKQVYFFTDREDVKMNESLGGHLIKTPCRVGHGRENLCCKTQAELDFFVDNVNGLNAKWLCHFDDDNYVNVPTLVKTLQNFNPHKDVYLGKPSRLKAMEGRDTWDGNKKKKFWFATGGAGFCLSRALVNRMEPHISNGKFEQSCERIKRPDDCTIGFINESLLNVNLTRSDLFHSHLEYLPCLQRSEFSKQISFGYKYKAGKYNRVNIDGPFNEHVDPSRFKSIHCLLYPETSWCPKNKLVSVGE